MYTVEFYEKADGNSELWDFLEDLRKKAANNKDARIQYKQISLYNNRVFYFYFQENTFVLLHQFRKKSQKTPKREIEKAKAERDDYLRRKETADL